jgi:hypothetical protein
MPRVRNELHSRGLQKAFRLAVARRPAPLVLTPDSPRRGRRPNRVWHGNRVVHRPFVAPPRSARRHRGSSGFPCWGTWESSQPSRPGSHGRGPDVPPSPLPSCRCRVASREWDPDTGRSVVGREVLYAVGGPTLSVPTATSRRRSRQRCSTSRRHSRLRRAIRAPRFSGTPSPWNFGWMNPLVPPRFPVPERRSTHRPGGSIAAT